MPNYSESLPELFAKVAKAENKEAKLALLRGHPHRQVLHTVLQGIFDPRIEWDLPEGSPPYRKDDSEYGLAQSVLEREIRKLPYFIKGGATLIEKRVTRERVFLQMLEAMHPSESELIVQMINKHIECDGLTPRLVWEFNPGLLPEPQEEPEPNPAELDALDTKRVAKAQKERERRARKKAEKERADNGEKKSSEE